MRLLPLAFLFLKY